MGKIFLRAGDNSAQIFTLGATLGSLVLGGKSVLDGYQTLEEVEAGDFAKSSLLIPFPNRIKDGKYFFEGKEYQLELSMPDEGHAIHGLVRQEEFEVISQIENECVLFLSLDKKPGYPFPLEINVRFALQEKLSVSVEVKNIGSSKAPVGVGWHPYFFFDDSASLQLNVENHIIVDERMIPIGEEPYSLFHELTAIADAQFDNGFVGKSAQLSTNDYTLTLWQDMDYLQVFIPPHRKSIALEPMSCKTDAFNNGNGLKILKPGEKFSARFGVMLEI